MFLGVGKLLNRVSLNGQCGRKNENHQTIYTYLNSEFFRKPQIFWRFFRPLNFSVRKQKNVENYPHKPQKSYPKKEHKLDKY